MFDLKLYSAGEFYIYNTLYSVWFITCYFKCNASTVFPAWHNLSAALSLKTMNFQGL